MPEIMGGVWSILIMTGTEADNPTPLIAAQVNVTPGVSIVNVVVVQPAEEAMPDSGSLTVQFTVTLLVYHLFLPRVPAICGLMTGGVVSPPTCVMASGRLLPPSILPTRSRA